MLLMMLVREAMDVLLVVREVQVVNQEVIVTEVDCRGRKYYWVIATSINKSLYSLFFVIL